jgi:flagellar hook-associated protein 2
VLGSISSLGVGSNLDLQTILDQLRDVEATPLQSLESQKADVEARLAEFDALQASFLTVKSHALNLSLDSNFLLKQITVSNTEALTASVAPGTADRTDELEVLRLATRSSFQSDAFVDSSASVNTSGTEQTFAYKLGSTGETISLSLAAGTTLQQLANRINDDDNNPGVTATIIDDGTGDTATRLVLTANNSGENSRITLVTPLTDLSLTEVQGNGTSLNAELRVNGITYQRQSNAGISDIVQGVTLNLNQLGTTSTQVQADTSAVHDDIAALVDSMNAALAEIAAKTTFNQETGTFGPLGASTSSRSLRSDLLALLSSRIATGGSITSLFDLGLEITRDGSLTLNEATLSAALATNQEEVATLFVGDADEGVTGLGELLNEKLRDITKTTGFLAAQKVASQDEMSRLQTNIETTTARLDKRFDTLARQFAALDSFASQMQAQASFLRDMVTSLEQP